MLNIYKALILNKGNLKNEMFAANKLLFACEVWPFITMNQSLSYGWNNNSGVDKDWSRKSFARTSSSQINCKMKSLQTKVDLQYRAGIS